MDYVRIYVVSLLAGILSKVYQSQRIPIVFGTFISGSAKFVDLSYYAQSCLDARKALHPLVANASGRLENSINGFRGTILQFGATDFLQF